MGRSKLLFLAVLYLAAFIVISRVNAAEGARIGDMLVNAAIGAAIVTWFANKTARTFSAWLARERILERGEGSASRTTYVMLRELFLGLAWRLYQIVIFFGAWLFFYWIAGIHDEDEFSIWWLLAAVIFSLFVSWGATILSSKVLDSFRAVLRSRT